MKLTFLMDDLLVLTLQLIVRDELVFVDYLKIKRRLFFLHD